MLHERRQALHRSVGEALETLHADRLEDVYDDLAYHYSRTDQAEKAVTYLTHVAEKAMREYALEECVTVAQEALRHVGSLSLKSQNQHRLKLVVIQSQSLFHLNRLQEGLDLLWQEKGNGLLSQNLPLVGLYYFWIAQICSPLGQRECAIENARRAQAVASACHDKTTRGRAFYVLAREAIWLGNYAEAIHYSQQAILLLQDYKDPYYLGMVYVAQGSSYAYLGEFEQSLKAATKACDVATTVGDRNLQCRAIQISVRCYARQGDFHQAIEACQQALAISPSRHTTSQLLESLGDAYTKLGEAIQAISALTQAIQFLSLAGRQPEHGMALAHLSEAYLLNNEIDKAGDCARQALALCQQVNYQNGIAIAQRASGRIAHARGDLLEAEQYYADALEIFTVTNALHQVGHMHVYLALLAGDQKNTDMAAAHLIQARHLFQTLKLSTYVDQTEQVARDLGVQLYEDSQS